MKIEKDQRDYILKAFHSMEDREDFIKLMNYAKKIIFGEKTVFFDLRQLTYYSNPKVNSNRYTVFEIKKKNKKARTIHAPVKGLLIIQRCLNLLLNCVFQPVAFATGFVQGRSIVDNAAFHAGNYYVYNIDLKDFFHSIDQARVWKCLQLKPLNIPLNQNLGEKGANSASEVVNIISALTCTSLMVNRVDKDGNTIRIRKNVLPQGAPTSPILSNIVCQKLDFLLSAIAKRFGLKYSRYADDITFSSLHNVYQKESPFLLELQRVVNEQGFVINEEKVRLQKDGFRQVVTGLIVNKHPNISREFIDRIKIDIYYWERYGYDRARKFFLKYYRKQHDGRKQLNIDMENVISGRLKYMKMVKGSDSKAFNTLYNRFKKLIEQKKQSNIIPEEVHFKLNNASVTEKNNDVKRKLTSLIQQVMNNVEISDSEKLDIIASANAELNKTTLKQDNHRSILEENGTSHNTSAEIRIREHSPKDVARFMSLFNRRDGLKYLTHDFDEEGEFKIAFYLEHWKNIFASASRGKNGFEIPPSLYKIIDQFAFSTKPNWTSVNDKLIYEGWSTEKWINWCSKNKMHPFRHLGFKVVIEDFKRLTRIESPNMEFIVNEIFNEAISDSSKNFTLKLDEVARADFYTHVPSLKRALLAIFSMMQKYGGDTEVLVSYQRSTEEDFFIRKLIVHQPNSYPTKDLDQILFEWNSSEKGAMGGIKNNLYGYCDWSIETKINETPYRINILKEKKTAQFDLLKDVEVNGFKHILTFYYI